MASGTARGVSVVAAVAALVVAAGCGGKNEPSVHTAATPSSAPATASTATGSGTPAPSASGSARPGTVEVFPGRDSEHPTAPAVQVAASRVGEPGSAKLAVHNTTAVPQTLQGITADHREDTGTTSLRRDDCSGRTLQPGESCDVAVEHTATQPGPFIVALLMTTPMGTVTIPLTGQADEPGTGTPSTLTPTPAPTSSAHTTSAPATGTPTEPATPDANATSPAADGT